MYYNTIIIMHYIGQFSRITSTSVFSVSHFHNHPSDPRCNVP